MNRQSGCLSSRKRLNVTVIIACYNHARFVLQALDSVAAQSRRPTQLIVTDDGSTDGTQRLVEDWLAQNWPDATFLKNRVNMGLPSTLNHAMKFVRGDLLAMMAGDDWMRTDRIEVQANSLEEAGPRVGMVWSRMTEVDEWSQPTGRVRPVGLQDGHPRVGNLFTSLLGPSFMTTPSVMMRMTAKHCTGRYDERLTAEDYDMWLRMSRLFDWVYVDEPLIYYRVVPGSLSQSRQFQERWGEDRLLILRKHLGHSEIVNRTITAKMYRILLHLYKDGRAPSRTAGDLLLIMRWNPSIRFLPLLAISGIGLPGPMTVRISGRVRGLYSRLGQQ